MFLRLKTTDKNYTQNIELSDEVLVSQYLHTGNKELIAILFERYTHLVYGICLQYLHDKDHCKDAVMEIFESLFEKLANHQILSFKNWLYSVSRNHCLMILRKAASYERSKERNSEIRDLQLREPSDFDPEIVIRNERLIHSAVESLNEEQKICVSLMYLEDKSYRDITLLTGFPLNQVKSHIQNGKRNLKNYLLSRYDLLHP